MPFLVAVQTQWERPAAPAAESEESKPHILYRGAFVLLTDDSKCRLARIENISILEAYQCDLLRSMPKGVESLSNRPCCALPPLCSPASMRSRRRSSRCAPASCPAAQPNAQLLIHRPNKGITSDRLEIEKMADKMLVVDYQPQGSLQALADRLTDDL